MNVRISEACGLCGYAGFLGGPIDIVMADPDWRKWEIIIHATCPKCHHKDVITLSSLASVAQMVWEEQGGGEAKARPIKKAAIAGKEE